jgi:hypothetical protein
MIYILLPNDGKDGMRVFTNFGLMEQVIRHQGITRQQWKMDPDWCTVLGYDESVDECVLIWKWFLGPTGNLIREPANQ